MAEAGNFNIKNRIKVRASEFPLQLQVEEQN